MPHSPRGVLTCLFFALPALSLAAQAPKGNPSPKAVEATRLFQSGSEAFQAGKLTRAHLDFARLVQIAPGVATAHTAYATVLLAEGSLEPAAAEFTLSLRLDSDDARAAIGLGVSRSRLGQMHEAVRAFELATAHPGVTLTSEEAMSYARALAGTGETARALTVVQSALDRDGGNATLLDAKGTLLAQQKQYLEAEAALTAAIGADPKLASAHAHLGGVLLETARPQSAVLEMQRAQQLGDGSLETSLQLGRALADAGNDAEAVSQFKRAVQVAPDSVDAKYALALQLQNSGDVQGSLPLFASVAESRPKDSAVLINFGLALVQTGDAKKALTMYGRALAAGDNSATLHEDMGAAYIQQNDIDHALEEFRKGLAIEPQNVQLHYNLGLAYKLKDDIPAAVDELKHAQELDPQLPDPAYTLGVIEMQRGNFSEATAQFQKVVAFQPENGDAWSLLGNVQKQGGDAAGAEVSLQHAITLQPDQPSLHVTLAAIYAERGDHDRAVAERKIAAQLSHEASNKQKAQFNLKSGRALLAQGKTEEAITQLQTAATADPALADVHAALAEAYMKVGRKTDAVAEQHKAIALGAAAPLSSSKHP